MLRLEPVTAGTTEPITLEQAKLWLRIDHDHEDDMISGLVTAARRYIEDHTGIILSPQSWRLRVGPSVRSPWGFPLPVELPRSPFSSLTSVSLALGDGTTEAVDLDDVLRVGVDPARVSFKSGYAMPGDVAEVQIVYSCALPPGGVPPAALQAIRMLISHWYEHREAVQVMTARQELEPPHGVTALLNTLKIARL